MATALAACGSDDDGDDAQASSETSASETSESAAAADPAAFCEASVDLEGAFSLGPPIDETAPPEEQQAALEEFGATVEPLLADVEENAPEEISEDVDTAAGLVREALSGGDPSGLESPEFQQADDAIDEYMLAECGFEQVEATGVDFEYEGLPDSVPAGVVAVTLTNEGTELHEIGIARINDDVTDPIEALLTLPEEEVFSKLELKGVTVVEPGQSETTFLRMDAGRYGAACFIPEGTMSTEMPGMGAPHFTMGMFAEFTAE
ncbi:hypothetical protein JKP75_07890 [Blastococcus sp. TML/M2B]|uniref:hypothetical protein n=1 Tax=unclassified Blastococcus TaxID=2619396 RepID=UPI00190C79BC|nr:MULTISPECIES: hypothetical protein [unclassified Blastococcus]MBN1092490.1 hypothetical protein [Blastococcus sp. TML/M2B]MBN1097415.1 hypothetical protein [Blastococcus sp. TML/C7B]